MALSLNCLTILTSERVNTSERIPGCFAGGILAQETSRMQ